MRHAPWGVIDKLKEEEETKSVMLYANNLFTDFEGQVADIARLF